MLQQHPLDRGAALEKTAIAVAFPRATQREIKRLGFPEADHVQHVDTGSGEGTGVVPAVLLCALPIQSALDPLWLVGTKPHYVRPVLPAKLP